MFGPIRKTRKLDRPFRRRLEIEGLEDRVLPSITVMEIEPNDKPNGSKFFTFPTDDGTVNLQGIAVNPRDRDFFAFTLTGATALNVTVGTTNGVIAKLRIDDGIGNKTLATRPKEGINV